LPSKIDLGRADPGILELDNETIVNEFLTTLESSGASPSTIKAYRSALKDFLEFIKDKPLREVSLKDVLNWRNDRLKKGFKNEKKSDPDSRKITLHYYSLFLNRFFEWLGLNIKIPKIKKPPRRIDVLSNEEVNRLINTVKKPIDLLILKLLLDTGLRSSELLGIRVEDIDFQNNTIRVKHSKYGKERYVIVTNETMELIKYWIKLNNLKPGDRLINLTYNALYKRLKRLGLKAGIPIHKIRPHVLRHTFATEALRRGLSVFSLQKILGHSDIKTTEVYLHLTIEDIKREYMRIMGVNSVKRCVNCGRSIDFEAVYCPYCGSRLSTGEELTTST